jgi:hypothetical protein
MKNLNFLLFILIYVIVVFADDKGRTSLGFNFMIGGRYDNLRMCVGSPAGVKGGPIADIMFDIRRSFGNRHTIGFKLPVFRPILFGISFKMLQFEPEIIYEYGVSINGKVSNVIGTGLGISFHYGPDFRTEKNDTERIDFFAAGPFLSAFWGLQYKNRSSFDRLFGIRTFYTPLFSNKRSTGTVIGAAFEGHFDLYHLK